MTIPSFSLRQTKTTGSWKSLFTSEKVFTNIGRLDSLNSLFFLLALGKGNVRDVRKQTGKFIFSLSTTKKHTRSIPRSLVMHTRGAKSNNQEFYTYSKYQAWNFENLFTLRDTVEASLCASNIFQSYGLFIQNVA